MIIQDFDVVCLHVAATFRVEIYLALFSVQSLTFFLDRIE